MCVIIPIRQNQTQKQSVRAGMRPRARRTNILSLCKPATTTYSPVILRMDLEQIPTEAFSSKTFQKECLNEHTKSPQKSEHGNIPKFKKTLTSSLLQHANKAKTRSALSLAFISTKSYLFRIKKQ